MFAEHERAIQLGKNVQTARLNQKLSQSALATRLIINQAAIAHLETGTATPAHDCFVAIAKELGLNAEAEMLAAGYPPGARLKSKKFARVSVADRTPDPEVNTELPRLIVPIEPPTSVQFEPEYTVESIAPPTLQLASYSGYDVLDQAVIKLLYSVGWIRQRNTSFGIGLVSFLFGAMAMGMVLNVIASHNSSLSKSELISYGSCNSTGCPGPSGDTEPLDRSDSPVPSHSGLNTPKYTGGNCCTQSDVSIGDDVVLTGSEPLDDLEEAPGISVSVDPSPNNLN